MDDNITVVEDGGVITTVDNGDGTETKTTTQSIPNGTRTTKITYKISEGLDGGYDRVITTNTDNTTITRRRRVPGVHEKDGVVVGKFTARDGWECELKIYTTCGSDSEVEEDYIEVTEAGIIMSRERISSAYGSKDGNAKIPDIKSLVAMAESGATKEE